MLLSPTPWLLFHSSIHFLIAADATSSPAGDGESAPLPSVHNSVDDGAGAQPKGYKIAIIGGGISGTFVAKYLAEYNGRGEEGGCLLEKIVVYDVSPPPSSSLNGTDVGISNVKSSSDPRLPNSNDWQGSRVSSLTLKDGSVIELGASIIYNGNKLVVEMMEGDPDHLKRGETLGITKNDTVKDKNERRKNIKRPNGFGIYHGQREWLVKPSRLLSHPKYPSFLKSILNSIFFIWRYNIDLLRLHFAVR